MSDTVTTTAPQRRTRPLEVDPALLPPERSADRPAEAPATDPRAPQPEPEAPLPPAEPHRAEVIFARVMEIETQLARARLGRAKLIEMMQQSEVEEARLREEQFRLSVLLGQSLESADHWSSEVQEDPHAGSQ